MAYQVGTRCHLCFAAVSENREGGRRDPERHRKRCKSGELAYVGKTGGGGYKPFEYNKGLAAIDIEISEDMFIVTKETAEAYIKKRETGDRHVGLEV